MNPYVVTDRIVFTYQPDGWPVGVITGRESGGAFHVEHVIVFPGAPWCTLMPMLRAGLEWLAECHYRRVVINLPDSFSLTPALAKVARRLGFIPYCHDMGGTFYSLHLKRAA